MNNNDSNSINLSALKWLYEMESLSSPVLQQNLYENILFAHPKIRDCQVFITPPVSHQKGILVYLKLGFWTKLFNREEVHKTVISIINTLLPSYKVRVVGNVSILKLSQKRVTEMYGGNRCT